MQVFEEQLPKGKTAASSTAAKCRAAIRVLSDCSVYSPEMLVLLDETGCDRHSSLCKFDYSLVGKRATSTSLLVQGVRYSAIGIVTVEGIQDSYITSQYIDAERFEDFVDECLLHACTPYAL